MKTKNKKEKTFDTVKVFREIKEKIAKETEKMTFAEFKEYLKKSKLQTAKQALPTPNKRFLCAIVAGRKNNHRQYISQL